MASSRWWSGGRGALSVSDATATEGEGATLDFELTMNRVPYEALTVTYETRDGTATAGSDYTATSGTLTIGEDETRKKVSVPVLDDDAAEDGETMTFVVTRLEGAHSLLLDGEGEGTITDDDKAARPMLSVSDASGTEGGTASFEVTLDPAPAGPVTTYYATADGTARSGSDYTGRWGTLAFAAGETSKTVAVELLDDELAEPNETFSLELITATGAGYGDPSGTGTIGDDDAAAAPTAAFDDGTLPAEHDGSTAFTVDLAFSEEIADIGYAWVRDTLVTATNGTVENARRADPPSNLAWELEVEPDGSADVTLTVAERLSLPDGRTLAGGDTATVGAQPAPTAAFDDETLPAEHDGSTAFTVESGVQRGDRGHRLRVGSGHPRDGDGRDGRERAARRPAVEPGVGAGGRAGQCRGRDADGGRGAVAAGRQDAGRGRRGDGAGPRAAGRVGRTAQW